jgi:hypothetical protein
LLHTSQHAQEQHWVQGILIMLNICLRINKLQTQKQLRAQLHCCTAILPTRTTRRLAGLATKQGGSAPVSSLHYQLLKHFLLATSQLWLHQNNHTTIAVSLFPTKDFHTT